MSLTYLIHFVYIGLVSKSSCEFLNLQLGSVYWQFPAPWKHISPPLASQVRCVVVAQVLLIADEFCVILLTISFGNCFRWIWCPNAELCTLFYPLKHKDDEVVCKDAAKLGTAWSL